MPDTIISDLNICQPASRLDRGHQHGTWRLVDYATEEFTGTMVYAGPGMQAESLTLPLGCDGYHAIYVGVHYPVFCEAHVRLRLTDDEAYTLVGPETQSAKDLRSIPEDLHWSHTSKAFAEYQVAEAFWKVADLTDQDLIISRFNDGTYGERYSNLVFVRLAPLGEAEVAAYQQELPRPDTTKLMAMNDGGIFADIRTREDIRAQLEPYRDSDVGVMLWAPWKGENCTFRSRIGRSLPSAYSPYDRFASGDFWDENLRALEAQGIDFMTELVNAAQALGIRIFPSLRLQTANKPVPRDLSPGSFYAQHPEYHCRYKAGRAISHLSLAFPQVRQFWIDLLCEALAYGFDGAHLVFCRSRPFTFYEEPVLQHFQDEYGEDARLLPDDDPRFCRTLAHFVSQFVREVKAAVDQMGEQMGKRLEIAYNVNTSLESNLRWGIDVETWVQEGLFEYLIPHPTVAESCAEWLTPLVELVRDTPVRLYPDLYPRRQPPAASLFSAQTLYDLGCDGIAFWDTYSRVFRISEWAMMKRLGHRHEIPGWRTAGKGNDYFRVLSFTQLGDRAVDPRFFQTDG